MGRLTSPGRPPSGRRATFGCFRGTASAVTLSVTTPSPGATRRSADSTEGHRPLKSTYRVLRPDPAGTIESLAALGYSPEAAIADLIDNSIAAGAKSIQISCHWGGSAGSWVAL